MSGTGTTSQMDIFHYMQEIEENEIITTGVLVDAAAAASSHPYKPLNFFSYVVWLLQQIPNLFGLLVWVNTYKVKRAYGGKEEGGWYYRAYTVVESRQVCFWQAESLKREWAMRYSALAWGALDKGIGEEVEVLIETRRAGKQLASKPEFHPDLVVRPSTNHIKRTAPVQAPGSSVVRRSAAQKRVRIEKQKHRKMMPSIRSANEDMIPCPRCSGKGVTKYKHVQEGICFQCNGERVVQKK